MIKQGLAHLGDLLQQGEQVLHGAHLLFVDEDDGLVQAGFHLLGVGDEVGGDIAPVKLHAFHHVQGGLHALGFFDGDDAFLTHLGHGVGDDVADGSVVVGADGAHLGDFFLAPAGFADLMQLLHYLGHCHVDAPFQGHGVGAGSHQARAFPVDGLGQDGGGGGAVAGHIRGLGGHFLNHLGPHVLELIFQFNLFGHGNPVLGDRRGAEGFFQDHVAAFGTQGYLHRLRQGIDPPQHGLPGLDVIFNLFSSHVITVLL